MCVSFERKTNFWNSDADEIKGSDGSFYPPFLKRDQLLWIFNPDICRFAILKIDFGK